MPGILRPSLPEPARAAIRHRNRDGMTLENAAFSQEIDQLGTKLGARGLLDEPEIVPFDTWQRK